MSQERHREIDRFHAQDEYEKGLNDKLAISAKIAFYSPAYGKRIRLYDCERDPEGSIQEETGTGSIPDEEARSEQ